MLSTKPRLYTLNLTRHDFVNINKIIKAMRIKTGVEAVQTALEKTATELKSKKKEK